MTGENLYERPGQEAVRIHTDRRMPLDVVVMVGNNIVISKATARRLTADEQTRIREVLNDLRLHRGEVGRAAGNAGEVPASGANSVNTNDLDPLPPEGQ